MDYFPSKGWVVSFRIAKVAIYVHWTLPLVGVSTGGVILMLAPKPWFPIFLWWTLGCFIVLLIHELGHMIAAYATGIPVIGIAIAGIGGICFVKIGEASHIRQLIVYAGGLLAQLALLFTTILLLTAFGAPRDTPILCVVLTFTIFNVFMILGNLYPTGTNDGAMLIKIIREMKNRRLG